MLRHPALIPLSKQHHDGLVLCVLNERSPNSTQIVDAFDLELRNHFDLEEELLFPLSDPDLARELGDEHRRLTAIVDQLRGQPSEAAISEFVVLLRAHIRREESQWFEDLQRTVPEERLAELGVELEKRAVRVCIT